MEEICNNGSPRQFEVAFATSKETCSFDNKFLSPSGTNLSFSSDDNDDHTSISSADNDSVDSNSSVACRSRNNFEAMKDFYPLHQRITKTVGRDVFDIAAFDSVAAFVNSRIQDKIETGSFLVTDLTSVVRQVEQWQKELPMVTPFYAVKCNPDPNILKLLASMGCSFDCATMGEIDLVLNHLGPDYSFGPRGLAASSIVYANPAKMEHMLEFAIDNGVKMTVFDGEDELYKIASLAGGNQMQLLLRLTTDDRASVCRFSKKFGCPVAEAPHLLSVAKKLGLHVAGVSFHVGSGCGDASAYGTALEHAKKVFDSAIEQGMVPCHILDLGGGFPGDTGGYGGPGMPSFQQLAAAIREGLQTYFFEDEKYASTVKVIAEPGRYMVSASTVITTKIYSRKGGNADYQALYVDDGVYGSFNTVVYDHAHPIPKRLLTVLDKDDAPVKEIPSAVFGPTCDGLDQMCSLDSTTLPRCEVGEWLFWDNQGAYTHTASFIFNGYTHRPNKCYVYSDRM